MPTASSHVSLHRLQVNGSPTRILDELLAVVRDLPPGAFGAQMLYSPTRVRAPMKKVNGTWREISWDTAIQEIADKLKELRGKGQPQSVAWISDTAR